MSGMTDRIKALTLVDRLVRRNPLLYGKYSRALDRWEHLSPGELQRMLAERTAAALRWAGSSEYGKQYRGREFEDWPYLEKEQLRSASERFYASPMTPYSIGQTSGTSGKPLTVHRSVSSIAFERAVIDRSLRLAGVSDIGEHYAILRGDNIKDPSDMEPPFWHYGDGGRALVMSSNHVALQTASLYAAEIASHAPVYMISYPTSLEALAGHLDARGETVYIPVILTQAEVLTEQCRSVASRAFSATVVDEYGQAERVAKANSFQQGEYRFVTGYSLIELLPTDDPNIKEIVGTTLWNRSMPLIRYRTGDLIEVGADSTSDDLQDIALGRKAFKRVVGRQGDFLVSPDGVHLMGIDHIPRGVEGVVQSQIVQEGDRVVIRVVPASGFGPSDRALLLENARKKIPTSMSVDVETVDRLERTSAGKAPYVIRRTE